MPNKPAKPIIFISYSHKDEPDKPGPDEVRWLTFVQSFLAPVVKTGIFDIWVDQHLHSGDDLDSEIRTKLAHCDVFVLLASRHSLASPYVVETEIATMRQRIANAEDVRIVPIILSPIPTVALKQLNDIVLSPKDGHPLSLMSKNDREVAMAAIADDIAAVAAEIANRKVVQRAGRNFRAFFFPRLGSDLERTDVDTTHLPETAYERLVGRDAELKRLDDAWSDASNNILSVIAEGGGGKSALVNEWLKRLQKNGYRGAEAVFGWSFYNQGTKERATSADEFLDWALGKLGIELKGTSASSKGEAIAEQMVRRRILLLLDGVEPLQYGPRVQLGHLKDQGLRALLRRFAAISSEQPHGLIVLTSRLAVRDIWHWKDYAAPVLNVERLSNEAGAALLRDNSVWGTDKDLKAAARDFDGYPLALGLLASFLKETQTGDVRRRDHIRAYFADKENPRHDHARRVMESFEQEWLVGQPVLFAVMYMVGLFDRPASGDCLKALRAKPQIMGLTGTIVKLTDEEWQRAVTRLREVRLLSPSSHTAPDTLDTHPLLREWFGEKLGLVGEARQAGHSRLFDHLRRSTKEGDSPTLEQLGPLYQAVIHGCKAGRYKDALKGIYEGRICRNVNGSAIFYASTKLCAFETNLSAISWFFDVPYTSITQSLHISDQAWLFNEAGHCLGAQGRFLEALGPLRAAFAIYDSVKMQPNLVVAATNLSEAEVMVGDLDAALVTSRNTVGFDNIKMMLTYRVGPRAIYAAVMHVSGDMLQAESLFANAEHLQKSLQPAYPYLYSLAGFHFCDFLLDQGKFGNVVDRTDRTLKWSITNGFPRDIALDKLNLARAKFGLVRSSAYDAEIIRTFVQDASLLFEAALQGLKNAGEVRFVANGFLARSAFRCSLGDWDGAARDLDEVEVIAKPGKMRLHLCDAALGRARLALARIEAFAPLYGVSENESPPKPERLNYGKIAELKREAEEQIDVASNHIEECGYHRRDDELAELQAVVRGERRFAELSPRV
jgi:tetratricopeptide (TPR) repeat protein